LNFKKWVKSIQIAGYNDMRTVRQICQKRWLTLLNSFLPPLLPPPVLPPPPKVPAFSRLEAELPAVVGAANISTSSAKKTKEKVLDGLNSSSHFKG
jgi:hypothetical protein